jgi:uncharacterized membrane protein YraQ (UPF0718 family)
MDDKDRYSPDVYRRLELVKKQFEAQQAAQHKQQAAEHKRERKEKILGSLEQNRIKIGRIVLYVVLGVILLAVIAVVVRGAFS